MSNHLFVISFNHPNFTQFFSIGHNPHLSKFIQFKTMRTLQCQLSFSLTRSTGLTKKYRKRKKRKRYRVDDRVLPEAIKGRYHKALGWTHKYDTSSYRKKVPKDDEEEEEDDEKEDGEDG